MQANIKKKYKISCVVVLYHPDDAVLDMIESLNGVGYEVIVVINGATVDQLEKIRKIQDVSLILNSQNEGLAKALNQGLEMAFFEKQSDFTVMFDQDSKPTPSLPYKLAERAVAFGSDRLGCIGPILKDIKRPSSKIYPSHLSGIGASPVSIPTSGTLIPRSAYLKVGPMLEELFIDAIDHEWCFRAQAHGLSVLISADLEMWHNMGDSGLSYLGRYKPLHKSPVRHYYIIRNTLYILRFAYIPIGWRLLEFLKLLRRLLVYLLISTDKMLTFNLILKAIADGFCGQLGKLNSFKRGVLN